MHRTCRVIIAAAFFMASFVAAAGQATEDIPQHGAAIVLFDGSSLDAFDSFLKTKGLNSDPEHVFRLENGLIHISGTEFGYLITKLVNWNRFTFGLAPLLVGIFFLGSVQLLFIGVIGEYIGSIFTQVQHRPLVIEKERVNFPSLGS